MAVTYREVFIQDSATMFAEALEKAKSRYKSRPTEPVFVQTGHIVWRLEPEEVRPAKAVSKGSLATVRPGTGGKPKKSVVPKKKSSAPS
jgi:hypothetical protein